MNGLRTLLTLALLAGFATTSQSADGKNNQQAASKYWLRLEKELGLQTEYSVDMEIQAMGMAMTSKTFRRAGQTRTETTMPFMNMRMVVLDLVEGGKPVSYTLFPDKKKYCLSEEDAGEEVISKADFKVTNAGSEVYEGVTCTKRHLTVKTEEGQTQEMDMLFSPRLKNMPVKMTATAIVALESGQPPMTLTSVILFKNYVFAPPPASLFVIPADYLRAKDAGEVMMEGMGGFGASQQPAAGQPNLAEMLRQAQEEAAKEEAAAAKEDAAAKEAAAKEEAEAAKEQPAANPSVPQGLRNLRRLLGN